MEINRLGNFWNGGQGWASRGLEAFFRRGTRAGIQPQHAPKLRLQLTALDAATKPSDLAAPGWRLHPLTGELVDYLDYH